MKLRIKKNLGEYEGLIREAHAEAMAALRAEYLAPESIAALDAIEANVEVNVTARLRVCGGKALTGRGYMRGERYAKYAWDKHLEIRLNEVLLARNLDQVKPVYKHELAHLVANLLLGAPAGHGPMWATVMKTLGEKAERCHKMQVDDLRRKPKRFAYECKPCGKTFELTPKRHKNAQHYGVLYRCGRCMEPITLKNQ